MIIRATKRMLASELIKKLQKAIDLRGDNPVDISVDISTEEKPLERVFANICEIQADGGIITILAEEQ